MPNRLITINKIITLNEKVQKIVSIDYLRWETKNDLIFCENVSEEEIFKRFIKNVYERLKKEHDAWY